MVRWIYCELKTLQKPVRTAQQLGQRGIGWLKRSKGPPNILRLFERASLRIGRRVVESRCTDLELATEELLDGIVTFPGPINGTGLGLDGNLYIIRFPGHGIFATGQPTSFPHTYPLRTRYGELARRPLDKREASESQNLHKGARL